MASQHLRVFLYLKIYKWTTTESDTLRPKMSRWILGFARNLFRGWKPAL